MLRARRSFIQRLDPDADKRRERAFLQPARHFGGGALRMPVLLRVRAIAAAILEIEPEVFDRFAFQFSMTRS